MLSRCRVAIGILSLAGPDKMAIVLPVATPTSRTTSA
jgi:hypothetical protein